MRARGPRERLATALSRRSVLGGLGAIGAGLAIHRTNPPPKPETGRQAVDDVRTTLNALITGEALAVTIIGVARQRGSDGQLSLGNEMLQFLRAAQCEAEAHYHFLESAGASPSVSAFTTPDGMLDDQPSLLRALIELKGLTVGAYMLATRTFSLAGDSRLVEIAYQAGATEAQHLTLARYLLGERPANDRAFARLRFVEIAEFGTALATAGYLGESDAVGYPGPVDRYCRGVFGLVPETTADVLSVATPFPALSSPVATPVATPADT